eukprot:1840766-Pyramimonas_sp.AAC.1
MASRSCGRESTLPRLQAAPRGRLPLGSLRGQATDASGALKAREDSNEKNGQSKRVEDPKVTDDRNTRRWRARSTTT